MAPELGDSQFLGGLVKQGPPVGDGAFGVVQECDAVRVGEVAVGQPCGGAFGDGGVGVGKRVCGGVIAELRGMRMHEVLNGLASVVEAIVGDEADGLLVACKLHLLLDAVSRAVGVEDADFVQEASAELARAIATDGDDDVVFVFGNG